MFGIHYTLDAWGFNNPTTLSNLEKIFNILNDLPDKIGMTKITQPHVFPYSGLVPEDKGITGAVIIAESHITIHTFAEKDYMFFDCFSCNHFDTDKVLKILLDELNFECWSENSVTRGIDFPRTRNV